MSISLKLFLICSVLVMAVLGIFTLIEIHDTSIKSVGVIIVSAFLVLYLIARYVPEKNSLSRNPGGKIEFEMDTKGIRRLEDGRFIEGIEWENLVLAAIRTTSSGPWSEDFFFVLVDKDDKGCLIPQQWPKFHELLGRLQKLPRWDDKAVIKAAGCTSDNIFECWKGSAGEASIVAAGFKANP